MPVIRSTSAPTFDLPNLTVVGLASPSRGSRETSAWRVTISPGAPGVPHSLDKEEIFVALAGSAVATLDGEALDLHAGDTLVVPSGSMFALANPGPDVFEAVAIAPVGVRAQLGDESFSPPWTL